MPQLEVFSLLKVSITTTLVIGLSTGSALMVYFVLTTASCPAHCPHPPQGQSLGEKKGGGDKTDGGVESVPVKNQVQ